MVRRRRCHSQVLCACQARHPPCALCSRILRLRPGGLLQIEVRLFEKKPPARLERGVPICSSISLVPRFGTAPARYDPLPPLVAASPVIITKSHRIEKKATERHNAVAAGHATDKGQMVMSRISARSLRAPPHTFPSQVRFLCGSYAHGELSVNYRGRPHK